MIKTYTLPLTDELIAYNRISKEPMQLRSYYKEVLLDSTISEMRKLDNQDYSDAASTKDWLWENLQQGNQSITWTVEIEEGEE